MNLEKFLIAEEGYIFNESPIYNNFQQWKDKKVNVLYITGLSGGGKGYTAKKIAGDRKDVTIIGIDCFENYLWFKDQNPDNPAEARGDKIVLSYMRKIYGDLSIDYFRNDPTIYQAELKKFVKWLLAYMNAHKETQFIVEGIQIYLDEAFNYLSNKDSIIVIQTSMVKSMRRVMARDHSQFRNKLHTFMDFQAQLKNFIKKMDFHTEKVEVSKETSKHVIT